MSQPASAHQSRRYHVVHETIYEYSSDVTESYGHAHLVPRDLPGQRRLSHALDSDPGAAEWHQHTDFFGNTAAYFAIYSTHRTLTVAARSEVEVDRRTADPGELDAIGWEQARSALEHDVAARAFTIASPLVQLSAAVGEYAAPSFERGRGLGSVVAELATRIYTDYEYLPGATTVRTTLGELLHSRRGVCQDFAHLAVGCLRSMGLAARYVSGYLETQPPPGQARLVGGDASHAWAEVLVPELGWVGIDPTNDQFAGPSYIIAACGRDYGDVAPLSGVIVTNARRRTMKVSVDVARSDR
jgi:transglutaminase-like putative cysteine protease